MNIEQMKARKQELGYSYEMIARMAGVSIATVKKIFGGEVQSPRYDTLQKLESVFSQPLPSKVREVEFKYDVSDHSYTAEDYNTFPEYAAVEIVNGRIYPKYPSDEPNDSRYKSMTFHQLAHDPKNGSYTYEDYVGFPGDLRVEIVHGYIYALAAANTAHQLICGDLHVQLYGYIKANGGQCVVGQAPYDVCLFEDGLTTVQPDVYAVCDRNKFDKKKLNGAPDLVIEVLSPSTAAYDKTVKLDDYRMAGVKEMWLVDYENGRIMVHQFAGGEGWSEGTTEPDLVKIYGMNDKVPVGIYDSALEIDFAQIDAYVKSVVGE